MKPLIFDSTPLIYLTRVGLAEVIEAIPTRKFTARSVFTEVVERGKEKGLADAIILDGLFKRNVILTTEISNKASMRTLRNIRGLEEPDAETLAIAKEQNFRAVVDDLRARKVARSYGVDFVGTPYIVILAINSNLLTKEEALNAIDDMIEAGWRCGPEVYREIIRLVTEAKTSPT